jgi:hypothetical protein
LPIAHQTLIVVGAGERGQPRVDREIRPERRPDEARSADLDRFALGQQVDPEGLRLFVRRAEIPWPPRTPGIVVARDVDDRRRRRRGLPEPRQRPGQPLASVAGDDEDVVLRRRRPRERGRIIM